MNPFIPDLAEEQAHGLRIVLPWPDKRLTPNAKRRKHWTVYRPAINADREEARLITRSAMARQGKPEFPAEGKIPVTIRFVPPDRRHRDDDGMVGAFKHARDGIAAALGVNDRRFRPQYHIAEPARPGRVEVIVGENSYPQGQSPCETELSPDEAL